MRFQLKAIYDLTPVWKNAGIMKVKVSKQRGLIFKARFLSSAINWKTEETLVNELLVKKSKF
ncbi:MAG: hypothetical protein QW314_02265 [Thermoproteota archaeon]